MDHGREPRDYNKSGSFYHYVARARHVLAAPRPRHTHTPCLQTHPHTHTNTHTHTHTHTHMGAQTPHARTLACLRAAARMRSCCSRRASSWSRACATDERGRQSHPQGANTQTNEINVCWGDGHKQTRGGRCQKSPLTHSDVTIDMQGHRLLPHRRLLPAQTHRHTYTRMHSLSSTYPTHTYMRFTLATHFSTLPPMHTSASTHLLSFLLLLKPQLLQLGNALLLPLFRLAMELIGPHP
jgi:hypothetical protein